MSIAQLPKVLVVDDEPSVCTFLKCALQPFTMEVEEAPDASHALEAFRSKAYDIVLSDICMPGASGLDLLAETRRSVRDLGFILVTGRIVVDEIIDAIRLQASDFLLKPFTVRNLNESVQRTYQRVLRQREARFDPSSEPRLPARAPAPGGATSGDEWDEQATVQALLAVLDAREHETCAHSYRVSAYTLHLAHLVGYPPGLMQHLEHAAFLHDIGKITVADSILLKPGQLTPSEWREMRRHVVVGAGILERIPVLRPAAPIVRHHHERFDGSGYPEGLAGDQIPLGARLFALADALDAMTVDRPYREARGFAAAGEEIRRASGTQFDPRLVEVFLQVPQSAWEQIRTEAERRANPSFCP